MNRLGQETLDQATDRLNILAIVALHVLDKGRHLARRVLLAQGQQRDSSGFLQEILRDILVVGFVAIDRRTRRQIEGEVLQLRRVTARARCQENLHGQTVLGHQQMDLHAIEIAPFAGCIAPKGPLGSLQGLEPRALDADVVTDRDRKAIDEVEAGSLLMLPGLREHLKEQDKGLRQAMQTFREGALRKHSRDVALAFEKKPGCREVAFEQQGSSQGRGHHLGVAHRALGLGCMIEGLEQVVAEAVYRDELGVHGHGREVFLEG